MKTLWPGCEAKELFRHTKTGIAGQKLAGHYFSKATHGTNGAGRNLGQATFDNFRNVALAMCTLGLMDPEGGTVFPRIDPNAALSRAWPPEYFLGADGLTAASRH